MERVRVPIVVSTCTRHPSSIEIELRESCPQNLRLELTDDFHDVNNTRLNRSVATFDICHHIGLRRLFRHYFYF